MSEHVETESRAEACAPQTAAAMLGVSASGLRRLAVIYAGVHGELPRDPNTRSRVWPRRAVDELAAARALVSRGRAASIREALEALDRGEAAVPPAPGGSGRRDMELLEQIAGGVRELRIELGRVAEELAELRSLTAALSTELASTKKVASTTALSTELASPEVASPPGGRHVYLTAVEGELRELRRRLRYLQAELELREV